MLSASLYNCLKLSMTSLVARPWLGVAIIIFLTGCQSMMRGEDETGPATEAPPVEQPPCPALSVPDLETDALILLGRGENEEARRRLECALQKDPRSSRAQLVLEQLEGDPVEYLGSEHFWYTVQDSETLSIIAERFLGSGYKFVSLARYNDIAVPDAVTSGQRLKIPGTAPSPPPALPEEEPPAADATKLIDEAREARTQGDLKKAYALLSQAAALDPSNEEIKGSLVEVEEALIEEYSTEAYEAEMQGKQDRAILLWKKTLEMRPDYIEANVNLSRLAGASDE